ncbi:MAG: hypothetical protein ACI8PZ_001660 [Myxococcota bacterium]|jgi:hypothetical protein
MPVGNQNTCEEHGRSLAFGVGFGVRFFVLALALCACRGDAPSTAGDPCATDACDRDGDGFHARDHGGADCDDADPAVHPNGLEQCNGRDDDCDGLIDDDDPDRDDASSQIFHADRDGDGFGDGDAPARLACTAPPGFASAGDCDDADAGVSPDAQEVCNGRDDDCDGAADDADPDLDPTTRASWFMDADADGFGAPGSGLTLCRAPARHVANDLDCADLDPLRSPSLTETCDGEPDNDCDGVLDPRELDADGDGHSQCDGDCADADPSLHPNVVEVCNGIDDDCDGLIDEADPSHDPYSCGWCPPGDLYTSSAIAVESWNPCLLDPDVVNLCSDDPKAPDTHLSGGRLHRIRYRTDIPHREELFLFFPPSHGGSNNNIRMWAAYAGFKVISLGHDNSVVLKNYCASSDDDRCYTDARHEIIYGEDTSEHVDVGPADSVMRLLEVLLDHLDAEHPDDGWDAFVDAGGHPRWERIVVAGWSRGAGTAGFVARDHAVRGQVYFSGPMDRVGEEDPQVANWIQDPRATPGCNTYGIYHTLENHQLMASSWDHLGVPRKLSDVDTTLEPYDLAQRLTTTIYAPTRDWCDAHRAIGMDECMDPALIHPYLYMMCGSVIMDPERCD